MAEPNPKGDKVLRLRRNDYEAHTVRWQRWLVDVKSGRGRVDKSRALLKPTPTELALDICGQFSRPILKTWLQEAFSFLTSPTHSGSPFLEVPGGFPITYLTITKMLGIVFGSVSISPTQLDQRSLDKKCFPHFFPPDTMLTSQIVWGKSDFKYPLLRLPECWKFLCLNYVSQTIFGMWDYNKNSNLGLRKSDSHTHRDYLVLSLKKKKKSIDFFFLSLFLMDGKYLDKGPRASKWKEWCRGIGKMMKYDKWKESDWQG